MTILRLVKVYNKNIRYGLTKEWFYYARQKGNANYSTKSIDHAV